MNLLRSGLLREIQSQIQRNQNLTIGSNLLPNYLSISKVEKCVKLHVKDLIISVYIGNFIVSPILERFTWVIDACTWITFIIESFSKTRLLPTQLWFSALKGSRFSQMIIACSLDSFCCFHLCINDFHILGSILKQIKNFLMVFAALQHFQPTWTFILNQNLFCIRSLNLFKSFKFLDNIKEKNNHISPKFSIDVVVVSLKHSSTLDEVNLAAKLLWDQHQ